MNASVEVNLLSKKLSRKPIFFHGSFREALTEAFVEANLLSRKSFTEVNLLPRELSQK